MIASLDGMPTEGRYVDWKVKGVRNAALYASGDQITRLQPSRPLCFL